MIGRERSILPGARSVEIFPSVSSFFKGSFSLSRTLIASTRLASMENESRGSATFPSVGDDVRRNILWRLVTLEPPQDCRFFGAQTSGDAGRWAGEPLR